MDPNHWISPCICRRPALKPTVPEESGSKGSAAGKQFSPAVLWRNLISTWMLLPFCQDSRVLVWSRPVFSKTRAQPLSEDTEVSKNSVRDPGAHEIIAPSTPCTQARWKCSCWSQTWIQQQLVMSPQRVDRSLAALSLPWECSKFGFSMIANTSPFKTTSQRDTIPQSNPRKQDIPFQ